MEVTLKKTALTSRILKQCQQATRVDFEKGEILGWCIYESNNYIVCYRSDINLVSKYPLFAQIEVPPNKSEVGDPVYYEIVIFPGGNLRLLSYRTNSEQEKDQIINILNEAKKKALEKGQFYI